MKQSSVISALLLVLLSTQAYAFEAIKLKQAVTMNKTYNYQQPVTLTGVATQGSVERYCNLILKLDTDDSYTGPDTVVIPLGTEFNVSIKPQNSTKESECGYDGFGKYKEYYCSLTKTVKNQKLNIRATVSCTNYNFSVGSEVTDKMINQTFNETLEVK